MAGEEEIKKPWPSGYTEAKSVEDFDYFMTGKEGEPLTKVPKSRLAEVIGVVGESMPAIQGGLTAATAVALPAGPTGYNRFFDASWGYWKYNNIVLKNPKGTDGIPEGNDGTLYWNGTATTPSWSISKMQALPIATGTNVVIPGGTEVVNQDGVYRYSATKDEVADSILGIRVNKFNKDSPDLAVSFNINPSSGILFSNVGTNVSPFIKVIGSTQYAVTSRSHLVWFDANKVYISGLNFSTNTALTFVSPANAVYVRYGYLQSVNVNTMMFAEGTTIPSAYVPYSKQVLPSDVTVTKTNLPDSIPQKGEIIQPDLLFAERKTGINLFNKDDWQVTLGRYINSATGGLSNNASYTASGYIEVKANTDYYLSAKTHLAWYNSNKVYISGSGFENPNNLQRSPVNAKYLRTSIATASGLGNFYVNEGSNKGNSAYEEYYELKNTKAGIESSSRDEFLLFIPDNIYVAEGRTIEMYFNQISWCGNHDNYHFLVTGIGKTLKRKWQITGTSSNHGSYSATCVVYDNNMKVIASKVFTVIITTNVISSAFTVVPIGDSLTNAKPWLTEVRSLAANNISFVGTRWYGFQENGVTRHEGRSGATSAYYTGNNSYTFDTSGEQGVDGRAQNLNPFFNPNLNKVDWTYYKSNYNKNPNKMMIWLGTNALALDPLTSVSNLRTFINGLRSTGASTLPIYIVFTLYKSDQNGIGNQTGTDGFNPNPSLKLIEDRKIFNLLSAIYTEFKGDANTYFIPVGLCHDSKNNYGDVPTPVNPRASQLESFPVESVHPQNQGYMQSADVIFSTLVATQTL
ncbi:hypothetical protein [Sphingobacterium sp. JUb56]|uniref:hypothetical protein n=1 Tax=Sphingobacterium sp. JUb56 TaxID=2587145 RepID=UPI00161EFE5B|nr:hypothetical protein [Sphingobacterium sp. JUb56]MBB2951958.1 hypothetical protein [Sphingobacterium sp. JUb56]